MDNVEFIKYNQRFCRANSCSTCPIYDVCDLGTPTSLEAKKFVDIITEWAKEHPINTRQAKFLKLYPKAHIDDGVLTIAPCEIDVEANVKDENGECWYNDCFNCRRAYWMEEVE